MKKEIYRCLRTLESFKVGLFNMWTNGYTDSAASLQKQYSDICRELKKVLSKEEFNMVQIVEPVNFNTTYNISSAKLNLMNKLVISVEMTIAYLRSLDMDLNKEIVKKELELKKKEEELEAKTKEVESMRRIYQEIVNIKKGMPEFIRSRIQEEIKKSHRGIEENTNPNTKSQKRKDLS